MNTTTDPYPTPSQTGIPYTYTVPEVWGADKWYVGQYASPIDTPWCADMYIQDKCKVPTNDYSYEKTCGHNTTLSQNVPSPPVGVSPLYYILGGAILYKYLYR